MIMGLALVVGLAAICGLSVGLWMVRLDETRVINRIAAQHVENGGRAEDCVARPGTAPVWLVVTCGGGFERAVNRFGLVIAPPERAPET